jgi:hypothetical protein
MNEHDKELFNKIMNNKERYIIQVDNDCVIVIDKEDEGGDEYETFNEYGYHLLVGLFLKNWELNPIMSK